MRKPKEINMQVGWRIPVTLRQEIVRLAQAELRTINAQAIKLLKEALTARKAAAKK